ncbi:MAG TPA: CPBP family intramembrane metalloprotease, partial [Candidatus Salinicoccus merdavium]|nr:CPBP family intramembrane metalloprotease [Candidatus Salinicoccus merdavium]
QLCDYIIECLQHGWICNILQAGVLEEIFYRVWLRTRLDVLPGTWPAIMVTSVFWRSGIWRYRAGTPWILHFQMSWSTRVLPDCFWGSCGINTETYGH